MAILKCKMCGGTLELKDNATTAECEYCGTLQTIPKGNNDIIQNLFNRANNLRIKCEFDKAEQIYEKILHEDDSEPEAHWGIILCKYGIEYVEDPKTYKRVPTCHRTSYEAIMADPEYLAAIEHADSIQKLVYESEARAIDNIQKNILNIVKNEKPFDVFICYKETDEDGTRTIDSTIANDIYYQLTQSGLKVFYAAITLEDKLGQEYEPYIFAALNSAKVMLVIGTKPEYYEAVWVKNEWSRFLKLMKSDRNKMLIPCYKDMDAYDLPEEFSHLQAQDMSKIGFIADLVRGIRKVTASTVQTSDKQEQKASSAGGVNTKALLKRVFMFIEDSDWNSADEYCERVLDSNPESADAYLGKLLVEYKAHNVEELSNGIESFENSKNYQKIIRFGDESIKTKIEKALESASKNQDVYMSVLKDKWDNVSVAKSYSDTLDYIKELLSLNTNSPMVTDEISKHISQADSLLRQLSVDLKCMDLFKCFQEIDQFVSINSNYSELMRKASVRFLDDFIELASKRIEYSLDLDELRSLLSNFRTLLEYNSIVPSTMATLKEQMNLCECKITTVEDMIEKEKKRKALVGGLEKELELINSQIATMQKNLYSSPEKGQIIKLEKENKRLTEEKEKLGAFKMYDKKALQIKIDNNNNEIKQLNEKDRRNIDNISRQLPGMKKRRDEIKAEIQRLSQSIN